MWTVLDGCLRRPFPLLLNHHRFTDAFFETISGPDHHRRDGLVMTNLDHAPPVSINLWRHELNWLGGMGIIVLAVAVLPMLGRRRHAALKAETPGPMKGRQAHRAHRRHAKALWLVIAASPSPRMLLSLGRPVVVRRRLPRLRDHGPGWVLHRDASVGAFDNRWSSSSDRLHGDSPAMNLSTHFLAAGVTRALLADVEAP